MKNRFIFLFVLLFLFEGISFGNETHFRRVILAEPVSLDPAIHDDLFAMAVTLQIYEGLLDYDENSQIVPALAKTWNISSDRKIYTFSLKKGVIFHNGKPFDANDVLHSFTRILDPKTISPGFWIFELVKGAKEFRDGKAKNVSGFKTLDQHTFQIELENPYYPFLHALATANAKIVPKGAKIGELEKMPIGTGAFRFLEHKKGDKIVLVKNSLYHGKASSIDKITFFIRGYEDALQMFQRRLIDFIPFYDARDAERFSRFGFPVQKRGQNIVWLLALNNRKAPFDDINFRKAIYYGIDQKEYMDLFGNKDSAAEGYLPYGILGSVQPKQNNRFHIEIAKGYLEQSKYRGEKITLDLPDAIYKPNKQKVFFENQFKRLGINAEIRIQDFPTIWAKQIVTKKFDAYLLYISANYPDPDGFLDLYFRSDRVFNLANYRNKAMDRLLSDGKETLINSERLTIYRKIEEKLKNEAVVVPLYHENFWGTWWPNVQNVKINSMGDNCLIIKDIVIDKGGDGEMKLSNGEFRHPRPDGTLLYYKIAGAGNKKPVALILHGGPGLNSLTTEKMVGPGLEKLFTMIYLDQRGCGRSFDPEFRGSFHYDDMLSDIESLRRELNIEKWFLIGHSFGSIEAVDYAYSRPENVSGLILVGPATGMPSILENHFEQTIRHFEKKYPEGIAKVKGLNKKRLSKETLKEYLNIINDWDYGPIYWGDQKKRAEHDEMDKVLQPQFSDRVYADLIEEGIMTEYDISSKAPNLKVPTLLIVAENDLVTLPQEGEKLKHLIKSSKIATMKKCGHFMHLEKPELFRKIVSKFLEGKEE